MCPEDTKCSQLRLLTPNPPLKVWLLRSEASNNGYAEPLDLCNALDDSPNLGVSRNQGPRYRPQILGLVWRGYPEQGPQIRNNHVAALESLNLEESGPLGTTSSRLPGICSAPGRTQNGGRPSGRHNKRSRIQKIGTWKHDDPLAVFSLKVFGSEDTDAPTLGLLLKTNPAVSKSYRRPYNRRC